MTIAISAVIVSSPPWVDLYISVLPATTTSVQVTRTWAGVSERVRGDSSAMVLGTDTRVVDWAAPVSINPANITYTVGAYSAAGALLETASTTVAATLIDHGAAWLSDPYDPTGAVLVNLNGGKPEQEWTSPGAESITTMTGIPLSLDTPRSWRERNWQLQTDTEEAAVLAGEVFESSTVLLRADPSCLDDPTGVVYVQAGGLSRLRYTPHVPVVTWSFSGPAVRGPMAPPAVSSRTYQDDLDAYPTYQASLTAQPTYLDRLRG